jgi:AcrR family transcriptional regulator/catechol 2,3-dioxygenase-like lactoylglutathione lyase family enzyme
MSSEPRAGRPKASSRETIAEAACELFLEQGYEQTSITDIASRAGVSRSSFFNYFDSKADLLWGGFDQRLDAAVRRLAAGERIHDVLAGIAEDFAPDSLALAIAKAETMGLVDELERERALRHSRLARAVAEHARREGTSPLTADVHGAAAAGAVLAAVWAWADAGSGRTGLRALLDEALRAVPGGGAVRQLRLVVTAEDFDDALAFYRDVVGMPQAEAYEAEGGARVAILDAGRATVELSNPAQVRFIDRVETDGGHSDRLRVALEVDDTEGAATRLVEGGAVVEASARETPWRSVNARLRGPAGLQVTLFQELGPREGRG